jgi:alkanesulfonate monooxygenase SsuD/methylene tetrahydromethanopterin reductase-like flavin-dependent oxidoreductase (luciferase family)
MGMLIVRFDFRLAPDSPTSMGELYRAGLEMTEWAEQVGAVSVMFSQHHGSTDGYLPSPVPMAAAAAARTSTVALNVGALLLLMYDPIKLAEDMVVLDHLSQGRVSYTIGLGYRDEEYAMFAVDATRRGATIEERIGVLRQAFTGEPFEWDGRPVSVSPTPFTPGGPTLAYGGGSKAAALRAARLGMMFFPQTSDARLAEIYDTEAERVGNPPGLCLSPPAGAPTTVFVADDVEQGWRDYGPYLLHDALMYGRWLGADTNAASYSGAKSVDDLRASTAYQVVTPHEAVELVERYGSLSLVPLCGGIPPDLAWRSLRLIEDQVLPALA